MPVRPALDTLRDLRDGRFLDDLSGEMNDLVRQVRTTDKPGKLTIEIDIKPNNGDASSVTVSDTIKVTPPKLKRATLFFTTNESNLSRRDPRQPEIPGLEDVSYRAEDTDDFTHDPDQEADSA